MLTFAAEYKAGQHYTELAKPVPTQTGDKIEVLEFFWYGCPHCFQFEPMIVRWNKNKPDNVRFTRVPAPLNPKWMVHTKTYYALELMDKVDEYHKAIFDAMHVKRKKLYSLPNIAEYLGALGMDAKTFTDTYNSFAVEMRARKAMQLGQSYNLSGVPMIAVNGKYVVSASQAGGYKQMLDITNYLIDKEAKAAN
jgi:thiol:disulfide interchange protein DsbA